VGKFLTGDQVSVAHSSKATRCGCGCGSSVAEGRKFLNQMHYDRSKGLAPELADRALARLMEGESAHTTIYRLLKR
jgi:hypothetical protein